MKCLKPFALLAGLMISNLSFGNQDPVRKAHESVVLAREYLRRAEEYSKKNRDNSKAAKGMIVAAKRALQNSHEALKTSFENRRRKNLRALAEKKKREKENKDS